MFLNRFLSLNFGPSFNFDNNIQKSQVPTILEVKNWVKKGIHKLALKFLKVSIHPGSCNTISKLDKKMTFLGQGPKN